MPAPFRKVSFGPVSVEKTALGDGSWLLRSREPLQPHPARLGERLLFWAKEAPDRIFLARRDDAGVWQKTTYAQTLERVRRIARFLLEKNFPPGRTVAILSENSIEHALLALAAMHVGIPCAPFSTAFSFASGDFSKLRRVLSAMTPGLVFAQDGQAGGQALRCAASLFPDAIFVFEKKPPDGLPALPFSALEKTAATSAVEEAFEKTCPNTIAKVLFTSGSTGLPKGVANPQRMLCANLQQIVQAFPFLASEPLLLVDWLPWSHTFGGNHNFGLALWNGGTLHLDDGKPTPAGIEATVQNLREIAPTTYFNVPKGFQELVPWLRRERALRERFFSRLHMIFYAGASLPQSVRDDLDQLAAETCGERIPIVSGYGCTESAPAALFANWAGGWSGLLGAPAAGLELKLAPAADGKLEARLRGPNITPGYWRDPEATAAAFDEEGFFKTGDALKFADPEDPSSLMFDGRIALGFKLDTGTWVNADELRAKLVAASGGLLRDAVITGLNRGFIGAIVFPDLHFLRKTTASDGQADERELLAHPATLAALQRTLDELARSSTGSSTLVERVVFADFTLSVEAGEVTEKGSVNQQAVLANRAEVVERIYEESPSGDVRIAERQEVRRRGFPSA